MEGYHMVLYISFHSAAGSGVRRFPLPPKSSEVPYLFKTPFTVVWG